jgi:hypothetical protein
MSTFVTLNEEGLMKLLIPLLLVAVFLVTSCASKSDYDRETSSKRERDLKDH